MIYKPNITGTKIMVGRTLMDMELEFVNLIDAAIVAHERLRTYLLSLLLDFVYTRIFFSFLLTGYW